MDKKIFNMFVSSINEFETFFNANKKSTIELTRLWVGACSGITIPDYVRTKDELLIESKALALWVSIGTDNKFSDVMGSIVDIIDKKTNNNMEGLKHYLGTFEKDNKEIEIEDLIKVLFIACRIKTDLLGSLGKYLGTVSIEGLLIDNIACNYVFIKKITELSLYSGVKFSVLIDCLILISCFEVITYSNINFEKITIEEQYKNIIQNMVATHAKNDNDFISVYKSILTEVLKNFKRVIDVKNVENKHQEAKVHNPELFQEVLNNSYDAVKGLLKVDNIEELPLDQYNINFKSVLEDVQKEKTFFDELLTNPKRVGQLEAGNHYMSHILKDSLAIKDDKVVFKGHTQALSLGYTQKGIMLSLAKEITLRELRTNLKHLEKYNNSSELIDFTNKLIEIIKRKTHAKLIPFKALAKEMGLTQNQAKQYAKKLITFNPKSFDKNFSDLPLHDFSKKA